MMRSTLEQIAEFEKNEVWLDIVDFFKARLEGLRNELELCEDMRLEKGLEGNERVGGRCQEDRALLSVLEALKQMRSIEIEAARQKKER